LVMAGHSDRPTALRWHARVVRLTGALVLVALSAGVVVFAQHTASLEQRAAAALEPAALARAALETQAGIVWMVRQRLLLLLAAASTEAGADARPYAVLTARRFSRTALAVVLVLALTGVATALTQVGSIPALLGTRYGHLLLLKLALLAPIVALAALNRRLL